MVRVITIRLVSIVRQMIPNGKLDITRCSQYWLKDFQDRGIKHICWDGCMFPNSTLENPATWNAILKAMIGVVEG